MFSFFKPLYSQRRLGFDVLSSFVLLQLITAFSIIYYMYIQNASTIESFSLKMIQETNAVRMEAIRDQFEDVESHVQMMAYGFQGFDSLSADNQNLCASLIHTLQANPILDSVFLGTEQGLFIECLSLPEHPTYHAPPYQRLPLKAKYRLVVVDSRNTPHQEVWIYLDEGGRILGQEKIPQASSPFDPRTREWYQKAIQTQESVWSDIYLFHGTKDPGMSHSAPLYTKEGKKLGVIGTDISLKTLHTYLQETSFKGSSFILTSGGEIIASPSLALPDNTNETMPHLPYVGDLPNKMVVSAFRAHMEGKGDYRFFNDSGDAYVAVTHLFGHLPSSQWRFMTLMPLAELIGPIQKTQHQTIMMSLLILFLSILVISYLAHKIAKPIIELSRQANRITDLDLSDPNEIHSGIMEIQHLQTSLTSMRRSLISFGKFVPKALVHKLMDRGGEVKIGGRTKKITLFFSDIQGFTSVSEHYSSDRLMVHLSEYLEELTTLITKAQGTIDKYIGDSIMAFWGAPNSQKDHALYACEAALQCQKRLLDLNKKWIFERKPPLYTRIGIHTGEVIVGNVGSTERLNYTAIGDSVNIASRLQEMNKSFGTQIILSHETLQLVRDQVIVRPLDIVTLTGKKNPLKIYELIAMTGVDPLLVPTPTQVEFVSEFEKAFHNYEEQRWEQAQDQFHQIHQTYKDPVSALYEERCAFLYKNPPSPQWEGSYSQGSFHTEKESSKK